MDIKGIAMISPQVKNRNRIYMGGLDKYEGKVLQVIDRNNDGDCLVLNDNGMGDFLASDILCFLPVTKKMDIVLPVGLSFFEEQLWISKAMQVGIDKFNWAFFNKAVIDQRIPTDLNFI